MGTTAANSDSSENEVEVETATKGPRPGQKRKATNLSNNLPVKKSKFESKQLNKRQTKSLGPELEHVEDENDKSSVQISGQKRKYQWNDSVKFVPSREQAFKKGRKSADLNAVIAKAVPVDKTDNDGNNTPQNKNVPFRRVKAEQYDEATFAQLDNRFNSMSNARGSWGEQANNTLKIVQGKSFKHEKTKKKRGAYMGGQINMAVNSIKF